MKCPVCGSKAVEFVGNDDNHEHRCSDCTVIFRALTEQAETPASTLPKAKKVQGATSRRKSG